MEYTVINYLFDKGETVSEGICFTSQSKVTGLLLLSIFILISNDKGIIITHYDINFIVLTIFLFCRLTHTAVFLTISSKHF